MSLTTETYMVKKYALLTQMKFSPPPRSTMIEGMTVDVTVASRDVRRLMRDRTTRMTQNLGPFSKLGTSFSSVVSSTEASLDSGVEAIASWSFIALLKRLAAVVTVSVLE